MSYIDDVMGFDPTNLEAFQEPVAKDSYDANIYKTNPVKYAKSEDGVYRSTIKIIYNPFDFKKSIVQQATYFIQDQQGSLLVRSKLGDNDKSCPLFASWKKLWFSGDDAKKEWAKKMYDKTESQWVLVQVLEDVNQPELVGKILAWKLPKAIFNKMSAKMNPSAESKKAPVPVMDYLMGLPLTLEVTPGPDDPKAPERKQREISYDLCDFDADYTPIIKVDGTPFFTEAELEMIDSFVTARAEVVKAKTQAKKDAAAKIIEDMKDGIKELYQKALDYLKVEALNLQEECGYKEWDENVAKRVENWINVVATMQDPRQVSAEEKSIFDAPASKPTSTSDAEDMVEVAMGAEMPKDDGLPF